jgi:hypothetical protein
MEIYKPKVTLKLQKQQNLGKFLIFDVFVQIWIFTLTTILEMGILTYPKPQFTSLASIFELHKTTDGPRVSN